MPGGIDLAVFLAIGLLGGAHCLGMCGPLVTLYADRLGGRSNAVSWRELRQHALFNLGRTAAYAAIGGGLGLLGGVVFDAAALFAVGAAVRAAAGIVAAAVIAAVGLGYLLGGASRVAAIEGWAPFARAYDRLVARVDDWVGGPRIAALGALHGVLPCPLLYPAFLYAFAAGSPARGVLALGALGAGTFPTLFLYGTVVGAVPPSARGALHRALGAAFVALAALPLSMGLRALGIELPRVPVPFYQPLRP